MKEGAQLVGVRTPAEYAERYIECAINLTLSTIEFCAGELGDQSKPVTPYCRSANCSGCLAKLHQRLGFGAVYNHLDDGQLAKESLSLAFLLYPK